MGPDPSHFPGEESDITDLSGMFFRRAGQRRAGQRAGSYNQGGTSKGTISR
jgi:hypothetical protein